jgi:hypothetical protein
MILGIKFLYKIIIKECRKTGMEFKNKWEKLTKKMGYWLDLKGFLYNQ